MRRFRLLTLAVALSPLATLVPAGAAHASAPTSGATERVLLALTPHNRTALRALAMGRVPRGTSRQAALAAALPSVVERQSVADSARALGLAVDRTTPMSVLVSGPASLVESLFGSARAVAPKSRFQHALPHLPQAFRGQVTAAFGGDDNRPAFRHFATATGTDFRTAYGDETTDPTVSPNHTETIATVQLSGWHSSDLTKFANDLKLSNPAWPTPSYASVDDSLDPSCILNSSNTTTCQNNPGDDVEVDLDQEALYAVAPYAKQRAYLSNNDMGGMYDSLVNLGNDAFDPTVDRHIVAASISWGVCEADVAKMSDPTSFYNAFEDVMSFVLASGVTVFAASGDSGSDCISYPATSPQVIAVGGTSATTPSDASTQTGWVDAGWVPNNTDPTLGASGGGASSEFPQPTWQQGVDPTYTPTTPRMRTIPDISALAGDPGFDVYTSSPAMGGSTYLAVGGTSLASPVAAASYGVEMATKGYNWGIGDIHAGLYAQPAGFTDVNDNCATNDSKCTGWNGSDVARAGYDRVTGLGTPVWSSLFGATLGGSPHLTITKAYVTSPTAYVAVHYPTWQSYTGYRIDVDVSSPSCTTTGMTSTPPTSVSIPTGGVAHGADGLHDLTLVAMVSPGVCELADGFVWVDTISPRVNAALSLRAGTTGNLLASWTAVDPDGDKASGLRRVSVTLTGNGHTWHPKSSPFAVKGAPGKSYSLTVTAVDWAGHSTTARAGARDDRGFSFSKYWTRFWINNAYAGSQAYTKHKGARTKFTTTARYYYLWVMRCKACGKLGVYTTGGKLLKTVDTYYAHTRYRQRVKIFASSRLAKRTFVIVALGKHNSHSTGIEIAVDGMTTKA